MKRNKNHILRLIMSLLVLSSCSEDDIYDVIDYNKLGYLITDNENLSLFNSAIKRSSLNELLLSDGIYTVLAPSDDAFLTKGYTNAAITSARSSWISNIVGYHSLDGRYDLNNFPFQFNQAIKTRNGHNVFVTRWVQSGDTVMTINGIEVLAASMTATNGYVHVLDKVIEPTAHASIADHLSTISSATIFSHALQRSGLVETLLTTGRFTLFAPNNNAMLQYGFASIQDVEVANTADLAELVKRHILLDMRFTFDYRLTTPYTEVSSSGRYFSVDFFNYENNTVSVEQTYNGGYRGVTSNNMLDGSEVSFTYTYGNTYSANGLERLALNTPAETTVMALVLPNQKNLVADNGVIHVINRVIPAAP